MREAILNQNLHWIKTEQDCLIERDIEKTLLSSLDLPHIQIITGVRRSGKSTLLRIIISKLVEKGINPKSILMVNFDDPAFIPYYSHPEKLDEIISMSETITRIKIAVEECLKREFIEEDEKLIIAGNFFNFPSQTNMVSIFTAEDVIELV